MSQRLGSGYCTQRSSMSPCSGCWAATFVSRLDQIEHASACRFRGYVIRRDVRGASGVPREAPPWACFLRRQAQGGARRVALSREQRSGRDSNPRGMLSHADHGFAGAMSTQPPPSASEDPPILTACAKWRS